MKALFCDRCNSVEIVEKDDKYICSHCGTVYTSDTVKKLVLSGSVSIDVSQELVNLFALARRAKAGHNHEFAAKYYEMILVKAPMSWEAYFYSTYFSALTRKITELNAAATSVRHCIAQTLCLLREHTESASQIRDALKEIYTHCSTISQMLYLCHSADSEDVPNDSSGLKDSFCCAVCDTFLENEKVFVPLCADMLKKRLKEGVSEGCAEKYRKAIRVYEPNYGITPKPQTRRSFSSEFGCYIATAVYGSYDCPPVWTLRRFRDEWLSKSWYGRGFIRLYYAISPHMVRRFGHMQGLCRFVRGRLDRLVAKLQSRGYESTPYHDPKE